MFRGCFEFGRVVHEYFSIHTPPCFTKLRSAFYKCTNHEFAHEHEFQSPFRLQITL